MTTETQQQIEAAIAANAEVQSLLASERRIRSSQAYAMSLVSAVDELNDVIQRRNDIVREIVRSAAE